MSLSVNDEVIKQRLLVDGEGTFEDKKINDLAKAVMQFANDPTNDDSEFELDKCLGQLESNGVRNCVLMNMISNEKKTLENLKLDEKISENKEKVKINTQKLKQAKLIRREEEEADALAAIVETVPAISETNKKIENLKEHFKIVEKRERIVDEKFDGRKREFFSLVAAAHQLGGMLEESKNEMKNWWLKFPSADLFTFSWPFFS